MSSWMFNSESKDLLCLETQSKFDKILSEAFRTDTTEEIIHELNKPAQAIIENIISTGTVPFGKYNYFNTTLKSEKFEFIYEQNPIITLTTKDIADIKRNESEIDNNKLHASQLLIMLLNSLKFSAEEELYKIIGQIDEENYFAIKKDYCDVYVNKIEIGIINKESGYEKIMDYSPIKNEGEGACHGDMHVKYIGSSTTN